MTKNKSLYIHIPFCNKLCYYCDFNKVFYNTKLADKYIDDLIKDLDSNEDNYYTIYIGGGSPSSLNINQLDKLLNSLSKHNKNNKEFTIEVNPKDIDLKKIKLFKKYNINRVSIGVQTFNEELLKFVNRDHTKEDVINLIKLLRDNDITNICCDLMFGIPNQTKNDILYDLEILTNLDIPHISTYALTIEPNTYFKINNINALNDDIQAEYFDLIRSYLKSKGYIHYEVSNFSKSSYQSRHNLVYWNASEYKGLGPGASGYENNERYTYTKSISKYIDSKLKVESSYLFKEDKEYEYIILHLRLIDGINLEEFKNLFNCEFKEKYKNIINTLVKNNLCEITNTNFKVKEDNFFILNRILTYF